MAAVALRCLWSQRAPRPGRGCPVLGGKRCHGNPGPHSCWCQEVFQSRFQSRCFHSSRSAFCGGASCLQPKVPIMEAFAQAVGQGRLLSPRGRGTDIARPGHLLTTHSVKSPPLCSLLSQVLLPYSEAQRRTGMAGAVAPSSVPWLRSYNCHCTWVRKCAAWGPDTWVLGLALL